MEKKESSMEGSIIHFKSYDDEDQQYIQEAVGTEESSISENEVYLNVPEAIKILKNRDIVAKEFHSFLIQ